MTEKEILLTVVEDAKQMYLLGIRLSDCGCINWWLTVFSGLSAKLCGFSILAKERKEKKRTTVISVRLRRGINKNCNKDGDYCYHQLFQWNYWWSALLLLNQKIPAHGMFSLTLISPSVCAAFLPRCVCLFSWGLTVILPPWKQFPMQAFGRTSS